MNRTLKLIAGAVLVLAGATAQAQQWPNKPVQMVNPFAPGGGVDAFGRPLSIYLSKTTGQQFIVENLAGAGGTIGAANAAKRPGDGYNFFLGAVHHTIAESLYTKLPYSLERDFVPITVLAYVPNVVVVHPKHADRLKSIKDLIAYAKANPGKLNYGSAGNGTTHHLAGELFKTMTGVDLTHIPYKGAGPMMQDLLAGQVDMAFDGMSTSAPQIKAGKLNYGSAGNGTTHHLAGELFKTMAGVNLTHIPYGGAGPMMKDLIGGQVDMAFDGMSTSAPQIKAGRLKALAVTTTNRSFVDPSVPTMQEAGVPGYIVTTWYALWAPKGTQKDALDRMYQETVKAMRSPELKNVWEAQGATAGGESPAEFEKLIHSEIAKWAKVVKDAGAKVDN